MKHLWRNCHEPEITEWVNHRFGSYLLGTEWPVSGHVSAFTVATFHSEFTKTSQASTTKSRPGRYTR